MKKVLLATILLISSATLAESSVIKASDYEAKRTTASDDVKSTTDESSKRVAENDSQSTGHQGYVPVIKEKEHRIPCHICEKF